ncbi:hypothetical protein R1sor_002263 [Riccia sorocarpa]|uniref:Succinate dehydrogenase assembly factor 4, mitochondrial n=1 Tax=Riccia sorocarpa TaxID=122646 RepID=A0ABD3H0C5_9MARC
MAATSLIARCRTSVSDFVLSRSALSDKSAEDFSVKDASALEDDEEEGPYVNEKTGEVGGPKGPEPTRYGDWERGGRCSDF